MPEGDNNQQQNNQQQQQQAPWHQGVEPEIIGHWQRLGWKVDDPKEIALAATKQAREAEKFMGAPPDQILRMPKPDAKPEDLKAFWARLGAGEAKDYDLSGIKLNGQPLDDAFATTLRDTMANAFVPKDKAATIAAAVAKHLESAETAKSAVTTAKIEAEKAELRKNWGTSYDFNHLKAMEGARRLGITPDAVKVMEGQIGFSGVMEAMRKIGANTSEDMFHQGNPGGGPGQVTTREGAISRKQELMADTAWGERYTKGGVPERQEMDALNIMIDGEARAA